MAYNASGLFRHLENTMMKSFKAGFHNVKRTLCRFWKQWGLRISATFWIASLLGTWIFLIVYSVSPWDGESACVLDGVFTLYPNSNSYWSTAGFFQITLSFSKLTFAQAKVVDVAWDLIVGRGGQTVMAIISWRTFVSYMARSMRITPVNYSSYRAIFLEHSPNIYSISRMLRDFATRRGLRSRVAMVFMISSMIFILSFPTLASSMTGYTTSVTTAIKDYRNNTVPFDQFGLLFSKSSSASEHGLDASYLRCQRNHYTEEQGSSPQNQTSQWMTLDLVPPVLDYKIFDNSGQSFSGQKLIWEYSGDLYVQTYIQRQGIGTCQRNQDYRWGCSFIQLFVVLSLLLIWSIGTLIMFVRSKKGGTLPIDGEYRSVISFATAMSQELNLDFASTTEDDIKTAVRRIGGGGIYYPSPAVSKFRSVGRVLKDWLHGREWWLLAFILSSTLVCFFPFSNIPYGRLRAYLWYSSIGPLLGTFIALLSGATTKRRLVFFSIPTLLSFTASIPIFTVTQ
ncbi:unnamed protein product [Periconia digitata]|uniref:Uncharacterized protein n=1 Tax=Periconia digitata TaxID=1303443 RepID=A0A9W4U4V8_9PLEO|nr:unnamed protein product [Periconia digitata]